MGDTGSGSGTSEAALEYRHKVEQDLTAKLDATLEPLVGAGRFRAAVSADTDLDQRRAERGTLRSDAVRDGEFAEDRRCFVAVTYRRQEFPGTASNLPDPAPASRQRGRRLFAQN